MSRTFIISTTFLLFITSTSVAQDENTVWLPGLARDGGNLGRVLAAGDINGDGIDDLLAATLFASPGSVNNKSQFQAIFGNKSGLQGDTLVHSAVYPPDLIDIDPGVSVDLSFIGPSFLIGSPPASDAFKTKNSSGGGSGTCTGPTDGGKYGTTSGDYDGDGELEIILGCPGRGLLMFFSLTFGRFPNTDTLWGPQFDPNRLGLDIGSEFATGDFNADGFDDLAVGVPRSTVEGVVDAGYVDVLFGSASGLKFDSTVALRITIEEFGRFGTTMTAGDYNDDGFDDLVVSAPFAEGKADDESGIMFLYNGSAEMDSEADLAITPELLSDKLSSDPGERFGFALETGDFNGDGIDDLAVGTPLDAVKENAEGTVVVVPGAPGDIATKQSQIYNCAKSLGIRCKPQLRFGYALAAGDFNSDGIDDLGIGVPGAPLLLKTEEGETLGPLESGAVLAVYGTKDGLDPKTRTTAFRSTVSIGFASHKLPEDVDTVLVPMLGASTHSSDEDAFGRRIELKSFLQPERGTLTFVDTLIDYIDREGQLVKEGMRGALRFTPEPDFNGFLDVEYTIGPPDELVAVPNVPDFATGRFSINVTRVNDPPFFITTSDSIDTQATVGVPFEAVILYEDIDSIPVVGVQTQPSWLTFQVDTFGKRMTVSGTPEVGDIGSARLRVVLTDEEFAVSEDFFFGVTLNPPAAPVLLDPKNSDEGLSRPVTISWAGASFAATYRVQVATSDVFMTALGANQQSANVIVDTAGIADTLLVLQTLEGGTQYFWRVTGTNLAGEGEFSAPFTFTTAPGVANENLDLVPTFALGQNYPNPFTGKTNISFSLDATSHAELVVFDSFGRIVRRLADGVRAAGSHTVPFDAQGLAGGVYFVRLKASGREAVATLTLLK